VHHKTIIFITSLFFMANSVLGSGEAAGDNLPNRQIDDQDYLLGAAVIDGLDVAALPEGRHRFFFRSTSKANGQATLVPVIVVKGHKPGKKLMLTAAVHGDELNGLAVIYKIAAGLNPTELAGTLIAVPGVNQSGLLGNNRNFLGTGGGGSQDDLNRLFPGKLVGGGPAELYVGALWHGLLRDNADLAVDLHTQTTGSRYPLFVFADFRNGKSRAMAYLLMPDMIKDDVGQKGTLETTFVGGKIPAVTFEIGGPKVFDEDLISRAATGITNLMIAEGMLAGTVIKPLIAPFVGSKYTNIFAKKGGAVHLKVHLGDAVKKGELVAVMLDPFGDEDGRYFAPHNGRVLSVATDPIREPGAMLVRILH